MDVVLVDRRRSFRAAVGAQLLPGDRLVQVHEHWLAAGRWSPQAGRTRAVLLAVHEADAMLLQALHRLWVLEHAPACYLISAADSAGERWLQAVLGPSLERPSLPIRRRSIAGLGLVQLLALQGLAASNESYQNE